MPRPRNTGGPEALRSWPALNAALRSAGEAECRRLLRAERGGRRRRGFLRRILGRLDRARRERERAELGLPS